MIEVSHTAHSSAPRDAVWLLLADLGGWDRWGPWASTEADGDGVGAERRLTSDRKRLTGRPYVMHERVTAMVPGERFEYDLLDGLPVRNYHAIVTLRDAREGGTTITWSAAFDSPWPLGRALWRGAMTKVLRDVSAALAAAAAQ